MPHRTDSFDEEREHIGHASNLRLSTSASSLNQAPTCCRLKTSFKGRHLQSTNSTNRLETKLDGNKVLSWRLDRRQSSTMNSNFPRVPRANSMQRVASWASMQAHITIHSMPRAISSVGDSPKDGSIPEDDAGVKDKSFSYIDVGLTLIGYMITSSMMSIANKMALRAVGTPLFLVALQSLSVLFLLLPAYKSVNLGSDEDRRRWFPVSLLFLAMLVSSMISYNYCSLGTLVIIHMGAPIVAVIVESTYSKTFLGSLHTFVALAVIAIGVVLYTVFQKTIGGEIFGIIAALANMGIGTSEHVAQRILMTEVPGFEMSDSGMMFYNGVVTCIGTALLSVPLREHKVLVETVPHLSLENCIYIALSCICAPCIGYMAIRAQRRISATSFLVITNLDKIIVVTFGILVLGEQYPPGSVVGAFIAVFGGLYYTWARHTLPEVEEEEIGILSSLSRATFSLFLFFVYPLPFPPPFYLRFLPLALSLRSRMSCLEYK